MSNAWIEFHHEPTDGGPMTEDQRAAMKERIKGLDAHYATHGYPPVITAERFFFSGCFGPQFDGPTRPL